jgi:hypothetical protein
MKDLGPKDERLALLIAMGSRRDRAAADVGVSQPTVYRRLRDPRFRARVDEIRGRLLDEAVGMLTLAAGGAVAKLVQLLRSEDERVTLRAALGILESVVRLRENLELSERLARVEEALAERRELDQSA